MQAFAAREYADAIQKFERALDVLAVEDLYGLYITKANCHAKLENWAAGLDDAWQAHAIDPSRAEGYLCMVKPVQMLTMRILVSCFVCMSSYSVCCC